MYRQRDIGHAGVGGEIRQRGFAGIIEITKMAGRFVFRPLTYDFQYTPTAMLKGLLHWPTRLSPTR